MTHTSVSLNPRPRLRQWVKLLQLLCVHVFHNACILRSTVQAWVWRQLASVVIMLYHCLIVELEIVAICLKIHWSIWRLSWCTSRIRIDWYIAWICQNVPNGCFLNFKAKEDSKYGSDLNVQLLTLARLTQAPVMYPPIIWLFKH